MSKRPLRRGSSPKKTGFDVVRGMALKLPGVEEGKVYGSPAFKVRGQMFACLAVNREAEPDTLVVRMPFDQREDLIAEKPETYYLVEHYVNYACVLVRLGRVEPDELRDLLGMGWQFMSTTKKREVRKRKRQ